MVFAFGVVLGRDELINVLVVESSSDGFVLDKSISAYLVDADRSVRFSSSKLVLFK